MDSSFFIVTSCQIWVYIKKYSLVYPYFKFVAIHKEGTTCLFIHIISMYTHILTKKGTM